MAYRESMTTCALSRARSSARVASGADVSSDTSPVGSVEQARHLRSFVGLMGEMGRGGSGERCAVITTHADELGADLVGGGPDGDGAAIPGPASAPRWPRRSALRMTTSTEVPLLLPVLRTIRPRRDFSASFGVVDGNTVPVGSEVIDRRTGSSPTL